MPPSATPRSLKQKPRYNEIADQIRLQMLLGKYPVGSLLPTEAELGQEFGVGRHTIREAIRYLQVRGLVSPEQGRGTRVDSDHRLPQFSQFFSSIDEIERYGRETHLSELRASVVDADAQLASLLPCQEGETLLYVQSYRRARQEGATTPTAWNETYIPGRFASVESEIQAWGGAVFSLIEHRFGERVRSIRQEAKALCLEPEVAQRLRVKAWTAGLQIKRTYFGNGGVSILYAFNTYVGSEFTLVMDIKNHGTA